MKKEEYIAKAEAVHGKGTYDYSLLPDEVICKGGSQYKITIICPVHGKFEQNAASHLQGSGCKYCSFSINAKKNASTNEEFIKKAKEEHDDKYDYSKTNYINSKTKVCIICHKQDEDGKEHGEFLQTPNSHLKGQGCPKCGSIKTKAVISNFKFCKGEISKSTLKRKEECKQELKELIKNTPWELDKYINASNSEGHCETYNVNIILNKYKILNKEIPCIECKKELGICRNDSNKLLQEIQKKNIRFGILKFLIIFLSKLISNVIV